MSNSTLVAKNIRCVSGLCKIAWHSFQLQQNCLQWRLRLRVQKAQSPITDTWEVKTKSVNQYSYLGIILDTELSDDKDIQRQLRHQYCAANKLRASFSQRSNAVKNLVFRSFCTPIYASQIWCNFRKSCMQRLHVVCNFGCRALYNLPWWSRVTVRSHQVQYNIPTFEALLWKNTCFLKDAESLTTHVCVLWCSQIFCIRPYSFKAMATDMPVDLEIWKLFYTPPVT